MSLYVVHYIVHARNPMSAVLLSSSLSSSEFANKMSYFRFRHFMGRIPINKYSIINTDTDSFDWNKSNVIIKWYNNKYVFGDIIFNVKNVSIFSKFAIFAPKNEHCNEINNAIVNMWPGQVAFKLRHSIKKLNHLSSWY